VERLVKGDVIVIDFPFSNLKKTKRRPVLVIKVPKGDDIIVCQITAESYDNYLEIVINDRDFREGKLRKESYVRIDKLATIEKFLVKYKAGSLKKKKFGEIIKSILKYLA